MILKTRRQTVDLSLDEALQINNRLSVQYRNCPDPERRREIAGILYQVNLPMFRRWGVYDFSQKDDYSQEAFFFISRALEKYDPDRGHFLEFLKRYYVREAQRSFLRPEGNHKRSLDAAMTLRPQNETSDEDTLFWQEARTLVGEEGWSIIRPCLFESKTISDVARDRGQPIRTINRQYNQSLEILRIHLAKRSATLGPYQEKTGEGDWLSADKFCRVLDITRRYLRDWLNPNRPRSVIPTYIDPRDVLRAQGIRIRYLFTARRGLEYPRTIQRQG